MSINEALSGEGQPTHPRTLGLGVCEGMLVRKLITELWEPLLKGKFLNFRDPTSSALAAKKLELSN